MRDTVMYDIERLFAQLSQLLGLTLTLHDNTGLLTQEHKFRPMYMIHNHPYCRHRRFSSPHYDRNCLRDCQRDIDNKPGLHVFLHHCWKGCTEIVFPMAIDGHRVMTLFAGVFRMPASRPPEELSDEWEKLPVLTQERVDSIKTVLTPIIDAIQRKTELGLNRGQPVDRAGIVMQYLRINFDKTITMGDLAKLLSVSPSRAGHVIKELFGKTLKELLTQIRISRVHELLQTTDYTIERIALMTGFGSACYLHRLFRRETGQSPVVYRKQFRQKYNLNP